MIAIESPSLHVFRIEPPCLVEIVMDPFRINELRGKALRTVKKKLRMVAIIRGNGCWEDTHSKCQNNNLVHLPALFFYCSDRKKKPLEHALKVCVVV